MNNETQGLIAAGEAIIAESCAWIPAEVRAPLFARWDAARQALADHARPDLSKIDPNSLDAYEYFEHRREQ